MNTITASRLVKAYGRQRALDELDLSTTTGVTGLLGPNGAGKTTLLRILATVLPPTPATSRSSGRPRQLRTDGSAIRRRLGYLPQDDRLPPRVHRLRASTTSRC